MALALQHMRVGPSGDNLALELLIHHFCCQTCSKLSGVAGPCCLDSGLVALPMGQWVAAGVGCAASACDAGGAVVPSQGVWSVCSLWLILPS